MYNVLNFGFPLYLVLFEGLVRSFITTDTTSFAGPALASTGMGLLIGIIKPKAVTLTDETKRQLEANGISLVVRNKIDERLINISWFVILLELLSWYYVCTLSVKNSNPLIYNLIPTTLVIGSINYFTGVALSMYKEKI